MNTLVAYASRYGATQGIAERVASTLTSCGHPAQARPAKAAGDLLSYHGSVVGSSGLHGVLAQRGGEVRAGQSGSSGHAPGLAVALNPSKLGFSHRAARLIPAARAVLPEGDFRNWAAIDAWAESIASELARLLVPAR
jgi:menaquinone-dependent protoporphyrinogen oxidase